MWKKIIAVLLLFFALTGCHFNSPSPDQIPNLNPSNETGWTVLHGTYVKTELGHDVLVYEPENNEEMYIFMTFAEECEAPSNLQTGDQLAIKIVIIQEIAGVDTTEVFALAPYGDSPVSIDSDVLSKIDKLSQQFSHSSATN